MRGLVRLSVVAYGSGMVPSGGMGMVWVLCGGWYSTGGSGGVWLSWLGWGFGIGI